MRTGEGEKGSATFGDVSEGPAATARAEKRRNRDPARGESPAAGSVTTVRTHRDRARFRARARSGQGRVRKPSSDCAAAVRAAPKSLAIHRTFSSAQGCRRSERAKEACMDEGGRGTVDGIRPPGEPYLAGRDRAVAPLRAAPSETFFPGCVGHAGRSAPPDEGATSGERRARAHARTGRRARNPAFDARARWARSEHDEQDQGRDDREQDDRGRKRHGARLGHGESRRTGRNVHGGIVVSLEEAQRALGNEVASSRRNASRTTVSPFSRVDRERFGYGCARSSSEVASSIREPTFIHDFRTPHALLAPCSRHDFRCSAPRAKAGARAGTGSLRDAAAARHRRALG